jgi:short-subunit dehydrogenase
MSYELSGKFVLVTGASSGIGAGLAVAMAKEGATVGICARREDRLAEILGECQRHSPASAMWVTDLADFQAVDELARTAVTTFGQVDLLVNNAGIPKRRHVTRLDPDTVEAVMAINYLSPVRLTLALLPQMLQRGEGRIINVSSVAASLSSPGEAAYDASKAALTSFSEAMAVDLWDTGIKVMVVNPGLIDTELFSLPDNDPVVTGVEAVPVSDVVEAVLEGLAHDALAVYVPAWFGDLPVTKAKDLAGFLQGTAEYVAQQSTES